MLVSAVRHDANVKIFFKKINVEKVNDILKGSALRATIARPRLIVKT